MKNVAIFPGSFDPVTKGHEEIIRRAASLFEKLYVAIGVNKKKKYCFDLSQRKRFLERTFSDVANIEVVTYEGLTVSLCNSLGAGVLVRGLRSAIDFEYEYKIGAFNEIMSSGLETIYLAASPGYTHLSSTIVREIYLSGGDITPFVPEAVGSILQYG